MTHCNEALISIFAKKHPFGFAAGVFRKGKLIEELVSGFRSVERGLPISRETAFHSASISKQFTAFAVKLLIAQSVIRLNDSISAFGPEFDWCDPAITIHHLLSHTSGLRDQWVLATLSGWREGDPISDDDVFDLLARQRHLNFPPGTEFLYCNSGYTLLARIVERVKKISLNRYLQEEIFEPHGMKDTRFREDYRDVRYFDADCYSMSDDKTLRTTPPFKTVGATSLHTSIRDIAIWFAAANERLPGIFKPLNQSRRLSDRPHYDSGLYHGWLDDTHLLSHSGWDYDFAAFVAYAPELETGAVIFTNSRIRSLEALTLQLLARHIDFGPERQFIDHAALQQIAATDRLGYDNWISEGVFGDPTIGDLRILETSGDHRQMKYGISVALDDWREQSMLIRGTLTRVQFSSNPRKLVIESPLQSLTLPLSCVPESLNIGDSSEQEGEFYSPELQSNHIIRRRGGDLFWKRPRSREVLCQRLQNGLLSAEGFLLWFKNGELVISHPRARLLRLVKHSKR